MKRTMLWLLVLVLGISLIGTVTLASCKVEEAPAEEVATEEEAPAEEVATEEEAPAEEEESAEKEPVELVILVKSSPEVPALYTLADMYMSENPHATITVEELGRDVYDERLNNQLFAKSADVDIVNLTNSNIGLFATSGVIANLDPFFEDANLNTSGISEDMFFPAALAAARFEGKKYAIPYLGSALFLYYRTDLIDNPPTTWDEYIEVASQFTKSINPDSPTEYGTTIQGKRGSLTSPKELSGLLWSFDGGWISDSGEVLVNNEGSVKALNVWVKLFRELKAVPPDITSYEYSQVLEAFQSGITVMAFQWDAADGTFADPEKSPLIFDKWAVTDAPGVKQADGSIKSIPYTQFWLYAMNEFSENKEEAFTFLSFINHPDNFVKALVPGISTALIDVADSQEYKEKKITADMLKVALETGQAYPNSQHMAQMQTIVDFAISQALAGELTTKEALDSAAAEIEKLINE